MDKYDCIIIGMGPTGLFSALELIKKMPDLKILMIDKGKELSKRDSNKREDLTCGFGGAGTRSDGKIVYSLDKSYGGNLQDYIHDLNYFQFLMNQVDETLMNFSDDKNIPIFGDDLEKIAPIKLRASQNGMSLLSGRIRHCGTDNNLNILNNMYGYLKDKIEFKFEEEVNNIIVEDSIFTVYADKIYTAKYVILGVGRSGNRFFENLSKTMGIKTINNQIDIGIRIEMPNWVSESIDKILYEPKLLIRTPKTDLKTRTFCWNPSGFVVQESIKDEDGKELVTVNGHCNSGNGLKSQNTNFALLVSSTFTEPFNQPSLYGRSIIKLCNLLAGGGVLMQRLKDLKNNIRSTKKRILEMNLQPTLKEAEAGDLRYALPSKQIDAILESIEILDRLMPGINSNDTILYAPEVKHYSIRGDLTNELETKITNLYAGGDGAGVSRGIAQSSMCGIIIAKSILAKSKN